MAACRECGEENPAQARYCLACGAAMAADDIGIDLQIRKTVTVVFCDLIGSTRLGERYDAEQFRIVVSRFFAEMQRVLERHGGFVEKFIGDAVMAVFGHPVSHEDDALRAVRAADEMRAALAALNRELERGEGIRLEARLGVNTGEVVAGEASRGHGFVTGDAVNVAKRLEEAAAPGEVVLGDGTLELVRHAVEVEPLAPLELKGKELPVAAHRLLGVAPEAPSFARRLDVPLVGRERELTALERALARTVEDRTCRLLLVRGPAGIGKTRVVDELLARAGNDAQHVRGRCLPYGEGITFWPIVEAVREAAGIGEADSADDAQAKIAAVCRSPEDGELVWTRLARVLGLEGPAVPTEEIFWAVRKLLEALAAARPVVAVFDDLQWAEPTLLDLLEYLGGFSRDAAILVCCLARPELIEARPAWAAMQSVALDPLRDEESSVLVGNLAGEGELAEAVRAELLRTGGGNPLFLEQLVAAMGEEGASRRTMPPTIQALLSARLDRLEPAERAVIERAAVVGPVFSWSAIAELSPPALKPRVSGQLQSLVRRGLVRPAETSLPGEDAFAFSHVLVRDAAYAGLPKEVRADLHEALAQRLERRPAEAAGELEELVGYHLEQAVRYRRELSRRDERAARIASSAGEHLGLAGRRALERGDAPAAANLLDRAASLLEGDETKHSQVLLDLAVALRDRGELSRAGAVVEQAGEAAERADDARLRARAELERAILGIYTSPDGAVDDLLSLVDRLVPQLEEAGDDEALAKAWYLVGAVHWERCRAGAMGHVLDRALDHARRADSHRELAFVSNGLARALLVGPTPADVALGRCREILAEMAGDRAQAAIVSTWFALLEAMRGELDQARERAANAQSVLQELGQTLRAVGLQPYVALIEELAGDLAAAERLCRSAFETLEPIGDRVNARAAAARLARVLLGLGRDGEAERFGELVRETTPDGDLSNQVRWRDVHAVVLARRGEHGRAEELAGEAISVADRTDWPVLRGDAHLCLAEVLAAARRDEEAHAAALAAAGLYEEKGNTVSAAHARAAIGLAPVRS